MRKGFELVQTRPITERIDVSAMTQSYNITFPPLFTLFIETFRLALHSSSDFIAYCPDEEVGFENLLEDVEKNLGIYKAEESYNKFNMLPFASSGIHAGGICVCLSGENIDKVFVNNEMVDGKYQLIAENIFEFIRGLIEVEDGDDPSIYIDM